MCAPAAYLVFSDHRNLFSDWHATVQAWHPMQAFRSMAMPHL